MKPFRVRPAPLSTVDAFYPSNREPHLSETLFRRPTAEYRGAPFFAWNCRLNRTELLRQIGVFHRMGFGGFYMHARTGLETPYLGNEFLGYIRSCADKAETLKMKAWLYDEDRWPSGFGGGLVTKDQKHRMKYILFTPRRYAGIFRPTPNNSCGLTGRLENGRLLARYAVRLGKHALIEYRRLSPGQTSPKGATEWFAYLETVSVVPWFNNQSYADTLSEAAARRFIEVTHEKYKKTVGKYFGNVVPGIFTDEPQHAFKESLSSAVSNEDVTLPATRDFFATYLAEYKHDLLDRLPEVFWELPKGQASEARYCYHDHTTTRFANGFARTLGRWCARNGMLLTGHMMEEPTLFSQTRAVGEAMRSLAHFQLPGIDMLCDWIELTTAKQAQSIAHQYSRPGVLSELYGVTGWDYDFAGYKAQGDWQAALGVTVRVPHLAWLSMAGEAKRDYPASINFQSPWWREYKLVEDHFARVNVAMTRGSPVVRVCVIHPIESYWLNFGPMAETKANRDRCDLKFSELIEWLVKGLIDFDYICEALLPQLNKNLKAGKLTVGAMNYDVVIVPALRTIRASTLDALERFSHSGGRLIFLGELPSLVDAKPNSRAESLSQNVTRCPWNPKKLVALLEPYREIDCVDIRGNRYHKLLHQLRMDDREQHLFICHRDRKRPSPKLDLKIRGNWRAFSRDTGTGQVREVFVVQQRNRTLVQTTFEPHGHLLLTLRPGVTNIRRPEVASVWQNIGPLQGPVPVTLSEPNVLLLDQAEWRWNEGPWQPKEELLRIEAVIRSRSQFLPRDGQYSQPWTDRSLAPPSGRVALRFHIICDATVASPELALESPASWTIRLDGHLIGSRSRGYWVDKAIHRVSLPTIAPGVHQLTLERDFTAKTELEWCYLLGAFGVTNVRGIFRLKAPIRRLNFEDWTRQGLPFYTGNVTYHCSINAHQGAIAVRFPDFKSPVLSLILNNRTHHKVAFAPFRVDLGVLSRKTSTLDITAFGNRHNAFGPLHNSNPKLKWIGPDAWRSSGYHWTYAHKLRPMGLTGSPLVERTR